MLTSYVDGTRVRWSSPRPGGRTADARGTTDTRLPAAEMVGTGLRSRRVERAEETDPSRAPEGVKKRNDARPTPGSEVQPHPRTGQGGLRGPAPNAESSDPQLRTLSSGVAPADSPAPGSRRRRGRPQGSSWFRVDSECGRECERDSTSGALEA
ncbi:hypothetical protein R6Z07F_000795 [Ovis aries]